MGAKRRLNGTSKVNRQTHIQTDTHTYGQIDLEKASAHRAEDLKITLIHKKYDYIGQHCKKKVFEIPNHNNL